MVCYFLLREATDLSYPEIGRLMWRHHSTVIHGVQQIAWRTYHFPEVMAEVDLLTQEIATFYALRHRVSA